MSVIKAYTLPHPPLAIPEIGRGKESAISKTLAAFERVAKDIADIKPETIIYITPHSTIYADHFHISPGGSASGDFGRFSAPGVKLDTRYDEQLVGEISRLADASGISAGTQGQKDARLDHGVMVPMWFISRSYDECMCIRISQSGMSPAEHYLLGQIISKAAEDSGKRVVVIGSSDLSHRLEDDGPYGYAPEGEIFDNAVIDALEGGDFLALFNIPENIRDKAGECGYNSLMVLAGLFDKMRVETRVFSYEGPFGVGYAVAEFSGTVKDENRNILEQYLEAASRESEITRNMEDDYQKLARQSLEHAIKTGGILPVPNGLPDEMVELKAGVFVSIHKRGRLRGCIGTIAPTTDCIAKEVIRNAVSAGLSDTRFAPVTEVELDYLSYKVDVLTAPEKIESADELDVKKYGVIVTSENGNKRGLLLPDLDGIDSVEEQIEIARSKGGISAGEKIKLERFEVIRHG